MMYIIWCFIQWCKLPVIPNRQTTSADLSAAGRFVVGRCTTKSCAVYCNKHTPTQGFVVEQSRPIECVCLGSWPWAAGCNVFTAVDTYFIIQVHVSLKSFLSGLQTGWCDKLKKDMSVIKTSCRCPAADTFSICQWVKKSRDLLEGSWVCFMCALS